MKYFFTKITSNVIFQDAAEAGILHIPLSADWEEQQFVTHIVPIWTKHKHSYWLSFHLNMRKLCAWPVEYPAVPKHQSRVRLAFHANNTESDVEHLVSSITEWAQEMMDIEDDHTYTNGRVPKAAQQVYACIKDNHVNGL